MKLKDFLTNIAITDLQGSPFIERGDYKISEKDLPRVISYLNQGLEYFSANYLIKTNRVVIKLKNGITKYYLDSSHAYSTSGSIHTKYICDTLDNPFQDDVLLITDIQGSRGTHFSINDRYNYPNVELLEYNCIELEQFYGEEYLIVSYVAKHPTISLTEPRDSNVDIRIPSSYIVPLQTYVACLLYQSMGGGHIQESNALFAKFSTLMEKINLSGIGSVPNLETNIKPELGGWI